MQSIFLVIPKLSSPIILGNDWLLKNGAIIDYHNARLVINGIVVSSSLVIFGQKLSKNMLYSKGYDDITYLQMIDLIYQVSGVFNNSLSDHLQCDQVGDFKTLDTDHIEFPDESCRSCVPVSLNQRTFDMGNDCLNSEDTKFLSIYEDLHFENNELGFSVDSVEREFGWNCDSSDNTCEGNEYLGKLHNIAMEMIELDDLERESFIKVMSGFEFLFSPKNEGAQVPQYH